MLPHLFFFYIFLSLFVLAATWQDASAAIKSEITHSYAAVKLGRIWHRHLSIGNSLKLPLPPASCLSLALALCLICGMSSPLAAAQNNGLGQKASGATVGAGVGVEVGVGVGVGAGVGLRTESQLTVQDGEISSHRQPRWRCAEHLHKSSPTRRKKREKEKKNATTQNLTIFLLALSLAHALSPSLSFSLCHCRPDEAHLMRADTKPRVKFNRQRSPRSRLASPRPVSLISPLAHSLTQRSRMSSAWTPR